MADYTHIKENRAFEEMMKMARKWLSDKEPQTIAENTGIVYNEQALQFFLKSMGTDICISYPNYEITPYMNEWQQLIILHYMKLADGMPLAERWIPMGELKDGLIRGGDFDRRCENVIRRHFQQISETELLDKCGRLGGRQVESNADLTILFDFLPYYPLLFKLWFADEEFPASGKLLVDASADHYLSIEDAVTVGQILMEAIVGIF